jgi:hypothetical protein
MPGRAGHRFVLFWVGVLALSLVGLLPIVFLSAVSEISEPPSHHLYRLTAAGTAVAPTRSYLHVDLTAVNEWTHTATLRVSGQHVCDTPCNWSDQFLLVSVFASDDDRGGLPPFQTLTFHAVGAGSSTGRQPAGVW